MRAEVAEKLAEMRLVNVAIWALASALLGFMIGSGSSFLQNESSSFMQTVLVAAATIAAAFGGAWAAYELQWRRQDKEKITEQVRALNSVQIELLRQIRQIDLIKRDYIDPVRNDPRKPLLMRNSIDFEVDRTVLNISALAFLLDKQHGEIILRLSLVEENYRAAIAAFNERSRLHREQILPLVEKNEEFDFSSYSLNDLEQAVGIRLAGMIVGITNQCVSHADNAAKDLQATSKALNEISMKAYPGNLFIGTPPRQQPA